MLGGLVGHRGLGLVPRPDARAGDRRALTINLLFAAQRRRAGAADAQAHGLRSGARRRRDPDHGDRRVGFLVFLGLATLILLR